jgi:hypothetical protein
VLTEGGRSVAVVEDTVIVAAPEEGAVYGFVR